MYLSVLPLQRNTKVESAWTLGTSPCFENACYSPLIWVSVGLERAMAVILVLCLHRGPAIVPDGVFVGFMFWPRSRYSC